MKEKTGLTKNEKDWLSIMSGKNVDNAENEVRESAENLREIILERHKKAVEAVCREDIKKGRHRLLFRLRKEGLLEPEKKRVSFLAPLALAASLALLILNGPIVRQYWLPDNNPPAPEQPVAVKKFTPPQVIYSKNPEATAKELAEKIKQMGISVEKTVEDGSAILVITITDRPEGFVDLLKQFDIAIPENNILVVEVIKK